MGKSLLDGALDSKGALLDSYAQIQVFDGFPQNFYIVSLPEFTKRETQLLAACIEAISKGVVLDSSLRSIGVPQEFFRELNSKIGISLNSADAQKRFLAPEEYRKLKESFALLVKSYLKDVSDVELFSSVVIDESIGFGILAPLIGDEMLEEIMVNGPKKPVFVFHKRFGSCKTNISIQKEDYLNKLVQKVANTVGRNISSQMPLLDARLPDGSRANATSSYVTPFGASLTIRKFTLVPLSIIDLISNKTLSSEAAAYLWVLIEGLNIEPMNTIICGGAGSGKTALLNVLASFIRYSDRIISIEDTLELHLGRRENWIQLESKLGTSESKEVSMNDLLKNALRMRPERIILGEVRGPEAQTLFVAMDTGHKGSMGTVHSNSSSELLLRLKSPPMDVAESMIPLLDLIITQHKFYSRGTGIMRRVHQITEVTSLDGKPLLANIFDWDRSEDKLKRSNVPSHTLEVLASRTGKTKKEILQEIGIRKRILEWMQSKNINSTPEVETLIQRYYLDPAPILEMVIEQKTPKFD